jgi:hypothetical protein
MHIGGTGVHFGEKQQETWKTFSNWAKCTDSGAIAPHMLALLLSAELFDY